MRATENVKNILILVNSRWRGIEFLKALATSIIRTESSQNDKELEDTIKFSR